ncbi:MAG TPA: choice-of-anchor tandem repeat GloVer-containing protein, partial [Segetibacter sp.]
MKICLLAIICFFACIFCIQAQTLYGTTPRGGDDGGGTISKFIPATNNLTVAKSFESLASNPTGSLIQASDGKLYGMTQVGGSSGYGVIFSFDPSSSTFSKLKDFDNTNGRFPVGSLMQAS